MLEPVSDQSASSTSSSSNVDSRFSSENASTSARSSVLGSSSPFDPYSNGEENKHAHESDVDLSTSESNRQSASDSTAQAEQPTQKLSIGVVMPASVDSHLQPLDEVDEDDSDEAILFSDDHRQDSDISEVEARLRSRIAAATASSAVAESTSYSDAPSSAPASNSNNLDPFAFSGSSDILAAATPQATPDEFAFAARAASPMSDSLQADDLANFGQSLPSDSLHDHDTNQSLNSSSLMPSNP
jgi:hypothetical protein